ncbi:hypothetical protein NFI96_002215 [Prochilodus magdalenae]|nr:hypothetical protein NFI96_002215 [Prochilodus magdalenae]
MELSSFQQILEFCEVNKLVPVSPTHGEIIQKPSWAKLFRGKKVQGEYDIRVEQIQQCCWTENRPPTTAIQKQRPVGSVLWAASCGQGPVTTGEGLEDDQHCTVQQQMSYRL